MRKIDITRAVVLMQAIDRAGTNGLSRDSVAAYLAEVNGRQSSTGTSKRSALRTMRALEGTLLYEIVAHRHHRPSRIRRIARDATRR